MEDKFTYWYNEKTGQGRMIPWNETIVDGASLRTITAREYFHVLEGGTLPINDNPKVELQMGRVEFGDITLGRNHPSVNMLTTLPIDNETSSIPCDICGGAVIEFSIPNDIWNKVIRLDGHEHDKEYLCMACFFDALRVVLGLTNATALP